MKIGIDGRAIGRKTDKGGVYRYIVNLILNLREIDLENQYIVFFSYDGKEHKEACKCIMELLEGKNVKTRFTRIPQSLWMKLRIPLNTFIGKVDIFHSPFDSLPNVIGCKKIVTIHDLRYFDIYPDMHKILPELSDFHIASHDYERWNHFMSHQKNRVYSAVQNADHILTVSEFTKDSLIKLLPSKRDNIHVTHNGISPYFVPIIEKHKIRQITNKYSIGEDYFLFVGQMDPFKNIIRIIDAYCELMNSSKTFGHKLVFVTPSQFWNQWFYELVIQKIQNLSIENNVRFIHNIPDEELPVLYSGAKILLLPSLYEGFGMPALEAMACGTPVIVSNICSLPEVVDDAALLVDPYSTSSIANSISKILSDKKLRESLVTSGLERTKKFSWEKTAKDTLSVYKKVFN